MASIRKRGNKWQARVCRAGFPAETKSFNVRTDAERWARSIETEMDRGSFVSRTEAEANTLGDIIERYIADVMPTRKGASEEIPRLRATCRTRLAKLSMAALNPKAVAAYRDERLKQVKPLPLRSSESTKAPTMNRNVMNAAFLRFSKPSKSAGNALHSASSKDVQSIPREIQASGHHE